MGCFLREYGENIIFIVANQKISSKLKKIFFELG